MFLLVRYPPLSSEVGLVASGNRVTREDRELENMDLQFPYPCTAHHNSEGMGEIYRRKNEERDEGQHSVTDPQRSVSDPDPGRIRVQSGPWIRVGNPDSDPEARQEENKN